MDSFDTQDRGRPLQEVLRPIRERKWLVITCVLLTTAAALAWSLTQPERYEAESSILVETDNLSNALVGIDAGRSPDPERVAATDLELVTQPSLAARVIRSLDLDRSSSDLLSDVDASANGNSNVLTIAVRDEDPEQAARIANAYAAEYVAFRTEANRERLRRALNTVRRRLDAARRADQSLTTRRRLRDQEEQLALLATLENGGVRVLERTDAPTDPVEPQPVRMGVLAGIVGLLLGIILVTVRDRMDPRLREEEDVQEIFAGVPVIAAIPTSPKGTYNRRLEAEGFRALRTTLDFLDGDRSLHTLLVTSATTEEGKTTTSLNLALAMAEREERVVLVEADLRRRGLSHRLGLTGREGTAEVLAGEDLDSHIVDVSFDGPARTPDGRTTTAALAGVVSVLPAGQETQNTHALLSMQRLDRLLHDAREYADKVVIDGTPLGLINDMLPLAGRVDGVVVVVRLMHARRKEVEHLAKRLDQSGIRPFGLVIFGTPELPSYNSYLGA